MTKAQAATITAALVNAGYVASVAKTGDSYRVQASNPEGKPVAASAIASFATAQGVTGNVYSADFS